MKRFVFVVMMLFSFVMIVPLTSGFSVCANAQVVKIQGRHVRLRVGPGLGYAIYAQVNTGTRLTYLGTYGDWYAVAYNNNRVFVSRDYASLSYNSGSSNYSSHSSSSGHNYVRITGRGVRLRTSPSLYYDNIYKTMSKGGRLPYLGTYGDFYAVNYHGMTLYVSRDYSSLSR